MPPPEVRNALRLATVEMLVEGVAPHAAVNTAVALLRANKRTAHLSGLANAVLCSIGAARRQHGSRVL